MNENNITDDECIKLDYGTLRAGVEIEDLYNLFKERKDEIDSFSLKLLKKYAKNVVPFLKKGFVRLKVCEDFQKLSFEDFAKKYPEESNAFDCLDPNTSLIILSLKKEGKLYDFFHLVYYWLENINDKPLDFEWIKS